MAQIEPLTAQKRMPTAENPELLEQTRLLNRTNFAVPARKMPTNGKRLRAEMAESQFAKTQNKNLNQEEKAQRLALVAVYHEKQPTKRDQAFERKMPFNRNVANRPLHALLGFVYEQADALTEIAGYVKRHRNKE